MKKTEMIKVAGTLLVGGMFVALSGCGYKTQPVPPQTVVPAPVEDLTYLIEDGGVTLNWSYPTKTIKGSVIEEIGSFDLYRAEIALEDYCGGCPIPFAEPLEIEGGTSVDGEVRRQASYRFPSLKYGYRYFFKVTSRTSWLAVSPDSNIITFTRLEPAAAPQGLVASSGDRQITLKWQPVNTLVGGDDLQLPVRYQLLRSDDGQNFVKIGEPVEQTSYIDRPVENGRNYFYAVESTSLYQDQLVEGSRSETVSGKAVDLTPPAPPTELRAVATAAGIRIFWEPVAGDDLGGYRIYRRAASEDDYQRIATVGPEVVLYTDRGVDTTTRYYYAVSSIDRSEQVNESEKSREATPR